TLLFSPLSAQHEAAASAAPLIAFTDDARVAFERDVLFPMAGLEVSEAPRHVRVSRLGGRLFVVVGHVTTVYFDWTLDFARASAAFEREALMTSPDVTLKFLNQFRGYGLTYTLGRAAFADRLARESASSGDADRWTAYARLTADLW